MLKYSMHLDICDPSVSLMAQTIMNVIVCYFSPSIQQIVTSSMVVDFVMHKFTFKMLPKNVVKGKMGGAVRAILRCRDMSQSKYHSSKPYNRGGKKYVF